MSNQQPPIPPIHPAAAGHMPGQAPPSQQPAQLPGQPQMPAHMPVPMPAPMPSRAPMGWYPVPGNSDVRWWDGEHWAPYRLRQSGPRADWYAAEPPLVGFMLGGLFIMLGLSQFALRTTFGDVTQSWRAVIFILIGCFWIAGGITMAVMRSKPAPVNGQILVPAIEPLPGRVEGPGAGWVSLSSRTSRWWSGVRWGEYIFENRRVRPTHGGKRAYRRGQILAIVLLAIGAISLIGGLFAFNSNLSWTAHWTGAFFIGAGATLLLVGAIIFPVLYSRRYSLMAPEVPPSMLRTRR